MNNWFEVKVLYEKMMENGLQKKVTEPYLVDALSHAEAEARAIEELRPYISGEFTVASVRRLNITELFFNEQGDSFWKVKVQLITLNEKTGSEKKIAVAMYAQASSLNEALEVIEKGMGGTMANYEIVGLNETAIMDVFIYGLPKGVRNDKDVRV